MIAIPVTQGDVSSFNTVLYGEKNLHTVNYLAELNNQMVNALQSVGSPVVEFFAKAKEEFNQFNGAEAMRKAKAILRKVDNIFIPNKIMPLCEIGQFQNASLVNQRFIMADPWIRNFVIDQRSNGWSETYVDAQPGVVGIFHDDYCKLTNGMMREVVDSEGNVRLITSNYANVDQADDVFLDFDAQCILYSNIEWATYHIKVGEEDPLDQNNGLL